MCPPRCAASKNTGVETAIYCIVREVRSIYLSIMHLEHTSRALSQGRTEFGAHLVFNRTTVLYCRVSDFVRNDSTGCADEHCGANRLERLLAAPAGKGGKGCRRGHVCLEV